MNSVFDENQLKYSSLFRNAQNYQEIVTKNIRERNSILAKANTINTFIFSS